MFDYMVKILPNGRLLVRNSQSKTSETIKASEISDYFQNVLKEQKRSDNEASPSVEAEDKKLEKEKEIREGAFKI